MDSNTVAILPGPRLSFLDHLIPLCHLWKIPLLCTDEWVYTCAQLFYPSTELILAGHEDFQQKLAPYQTFVTVEPCRLHNKAFQFGEFIYRGEAKTIAGFHGNPLKFRTEYWIERYIHEDQVLIYGDYLIEYLKEKGVWDHLKKSLLIGNLRKKFYDAHQLFFKRVAQPHLFASNQRQTLLWAPTWSYPHFSNPFEEALENIPTDFQVLIKLHPFMYRLYPAETAALKERYTASDQVLFLDEIPLIYPLLAQTDFYVGDSSSIACDFLFFNRPLFLIGENEYPWAKRTKGGASLFEDLRQRDCLSEMRQQAYRYFYECSGNFTG